MQQKTKKLIGLTMLLLMLISTVIGVSAYADFGDGVEVIASDLKIVKTGLVGQKIVFSDADFKQGLCIADFEKIKIQKLPASSEGTLMLAGRRVGEGTEIKRKNIGALVFIPASKEIEECKFTFTISEFAGGSEIEFVLRFTQKVNYAPTAVNDESEECLSVSTQRDVAAFGRMYGYDAENDTLEFVIVKYPAHGTLQILSAESGEYLYTPPYQYTGGDKFSYVIKDSYGNYSELCTVEITVTERMSEAVYVDMKNHKEYNDALTLTAMGIMDGKLIGDGVYFDPDSKITRAEFVTMAMKCASVKPDASLTSTYFDDNAAIPTALVSYVATAQKLGIINGKFTNNALLFGPNDYITKYEAGVIMANILSATHEGEAPVFSDLDTVPVWAHNDIYALCSLGIFESGSEIYGNAELTKAEVASYLCKMMDCN